MNYKHVIDLNLNSGFSFSRFCDWSPQEMEEIHLKSTFNTFLKQHLIQNRLQWLQRAKTWQYSIPSKYLFLSASVSLSIMSLIESHPDLFFTQWVT